MMKQYKPFLLISVMCLAASCGSLTSVAPVISPTNSITVVVPTPAPVQPATNVEPKKNQKPVVNQLTANPTNVVKKDDTITFKVIAFDGDGDTLAYSWSATKGTISTTQGEVVSWMPQRSDGSVESGVAVISVFVRDNKGGTDTSSVNITIDQNGGARQENVQVPTPTSSDSTTPSPESTPEPIAASASPVASQTSEPSPTPVPSSLLPAFDS